MEKLTDNTIDTLLFYLLETREFEQVEKIQDWLDKGYEICADGGPLNLPYKLLYAYDRGKKRGEHQFPIDIAHQDSLNIIQEILFFYIRSIATL